MGRKRGENYVKRTNKKKYIPVRLQSEDWSVQKKKLLRDMQSNVLIDYKQSEFVFASSIIGDRYWNDVVGVQKSVGLLLIVAHGLGREFESSDLKNFYCSFNVSRSLYQLESRGLVLCTNKTDLATVSFARIANRYKVTTSGHDIVLEYYRTIVKIMDSEVFDVSIGSIFKDRKKFLEWLYYSEE